MPNFSPVSAALILVLQALLPSTWAKSSCNSSSLNTTSSLYTITAPNTTVFDVARLFNRGICDIGRANLMADVEIVPNAGQQLIIPPEVCDPDNNTCLLPKNTNTTRTCIYGGPRLYYTVNGDTYERIALQRLNITVESLMPARAGANATSATDLLPPGMFVKVPQCDPSQCVTQPYRFSSGVYKDLAEKYGTTVGQIMMLSPTYNYSSSGFTGASPPSIVVPMNCTLLSSNYTVLS